MAGLKVSQLTLMMVVLLVVALFLSQSSSARPIVQIQSEKFIATNPAMNMVLDQENKGGVLPADPCVGVDLPLEKRIGRYGGLVLNVLPKGTITPSGPSKRTNNMNN
ncbi:hypothetical protein ACHQM5_020510 [Ranunculus cassubicifolius]